jgi:hypothetical protein
MTTIAAAVFSEARTGGLLREGFGKGVDVLVFSGDPGGTPCRLRIPWKHAQGFSRQSQFAFGPARRSWRRIERRRQIASLYLSPQRDYGDPEKSRRLVRIQCIVGVVAPEEGTLVVTDAAAMNGHGWVLRKIRGISIHSSLGLSANRAGCCAQNALYYFARNDPTARAS